MIPIWGICLKKKCHIGTRLKKQNTNFSTEFFNNLIGFILVNALHLYSSMGEGLQLAFASTPNTQLLFSKANNLNLQWELFSLNWRGV